MNILGITDSIAGRAAVVSNGPVVPAVSEERLDLWPTLDRLGRWSGKASSGL